MFVFHTTEMKKVKSQNKKNKLYINMYTYEVTTMQFVFANTLTTIIKTSETLHVSKANKYKKLIII